MKSLTITRTPEANLKWGINPQECPYYVKKGVNYKLSVCDAYIHVSLKNHTFISHDQLKLSKISSNAK